jgi:hypothetical protein
MHAFLRTEPGMKPYFSDSQLICGLVRRNDGRLGLAQAA